MAEDRHDAAADSPNREADLEADGRFDLETSRPQSLGTLVSGIAGDLSTLIRKEVELARGEIQEILRSKLRGAALGALGLILVALVVPMVLWTIVEVLDIWLPRWSATLIVTGAIMALAVLAFLLAKRALDSKFLPEKTIESVKEDVRWAKQLKQR